jgi:excisionase family DNA binding protein
VDEQLGNRTGATILPATEPGRNEPVPVISTQTIVTEPAREPTAEAVGSPSWLQPLLLDIAELAVLLNISTRTAKRLARANAIPGLCRLGRCVRFERRAIEAWVAEGCPARTDRSKRRWR